jgi:hypothetical protein
MAPKIKVTDKLLLAAKAPCSPRTIDKMLTGAPVRPLIESRVRQLAAELDIALPAPRASKPVRP